MCSNMEVHWVCLASLLLIYTINCQPQSSLPTVGGRVYQALNISSGCFRLTNSTHQIGCSATLSNQYGVLEYVDSNCDFARLLHTGPTPPYLALLEQDCFTVDKLMELQSLPDRVRGLVFRIDNSTRDSRDQFSPESQCPNDGFGSSSCSEPWNPLGNNLLGHDFGDLPMVVVSSDQFEIMLECYRDHNANVSADSFGEYPLCSAEIRSDMYSAIDTPTCGRRETLPVNYLTGDNICSALGDRNIWGTPFPLPDTITQPIVLLTTKLDGVSFFPLSFSQGAQAEVAGIVTLLAIIEAIGVMQRSKRVLGTGSPIVYSFLNGESWDYIGSSRVIYDMEQGKFPYEPDQTKSQPPLMGLSSVSTILELSQLGLGLNNTLYLHGARQNTDLTEALRTGLEAVGLNLSLASGRPSNELPPSSLQRFIRAGITRNPEFQGLVLAGFNEQFTNKFYGSRYDDLDNLVGDSSLEELAGKLADIATAVGNTVLSAAGPECADPDNCSLVADQDLIRELLSCFLANANCSLFRSVSVADLPMGPLERYVTVVEDLNLASAVVFQLTAMLSNFNSTLTTLPECYQQINTTDQVTNKTVLPVNDTHCFCAWSYTHFHKAESPAFVINDLTSKDYSTWAESRWNYVTITMYLVGHPAVEGAALAAGVLMTLLTLLVAVQCGRRADRLFSTPTRHDPYHVS